MQPSIPIKFYNYMLCHIFHAIKTTLFGMTMHVRILQELHGLSSANNITSMPCFVLSPVLNPIKHLLDETRFRKKLNDFISGSLTYISGISTN